jgi:hypothetical protein
MSGKEFFIGCLTLEGETLVKKHPVTAQNILGE